MYAFLTQMFRNLVIDIDDIFVNNLFGYIGITQIAAKRTRSCAKLINQHPNRPDVHLLIMFMSLLDHLRS
jgi:hypothetical protein